MVNNELLMQFQSDILATSVVRPKIAETTALGVAYAAGLATGYWKGRDELLQNWSVDTRWQPRMESGQRDKLYGDWKRAVKRSLDWVE
jgi:glycerol kinase